VPFKLCTQHVLIYSHYCIHIILNVHSELGEGGGSVTNLALCLGDKLQGWRPIPGRVWCVFGPPCLVGSGAHPASWETALPTAQWMTSRSSVSARLHSAPRTNTYWRSVQRLAMGWTIRVWTPRGVNPSRPTQTPTQPPAQWVPGLLPGVNRPRRDNHPSPFSAVVKVRVKLYR
jgi:hypothetical protein